VEAGAVTHGAVRCSAWLGDFVGMLADMIPRYVKPPKCEDANDAKRKREIPELGGDAAQGEDEKP